ncbi:hypothetical protein [Methanosphaerula palustris]|uniref:Uncharacterized protein n=1 Tax=Methanosphaerula palustris (strain ATCC BAA-1556 / DSM 19958 / E1-9c) TaxID=521011 RepID=B8GDI0_METPE|nr:hypothetical protein [Methanosphaerula palustris]ACL17331.1 hypothetical protein Mpal_2032 [Methanosphaerula palustris E1-9c]
MSTEHAEDTGAEPIFPYLRRHAIEYEAVARLRGLGYGVIRTDGRYPGVNLIAMKGDHFRFVCVRRRKKPAGPVIEVAATYAEDLYELRRYISPIVTADLWIWSTADRWRYFAVYPGGIQETGEDDGRRL